jgi:methylthioribose-1-phosphate isomerase
MNLSGPDSAPITWFDGTLRILDQTKLPGKEEYIKLDDYRDLADAIKQLKVRGAPAIGVAGAYGVALGAQKITAKTRESFLIELFRIIDEIAATRPTARNLFYALERMKHAAESGKNSGDIQKRLLAEAKSIHQYEIDATERISRYGAERIQDGWTILTHCNAGPLATGGAGTALGVIIAAHRQGKKISVLADETRPLLQGARLTAWELKKAKVPVKLITDSMAGHFMKAGKVDCVITGADRITANGDTANKIGTYTLAVLAKENHIPFYIAAPVSTIDITLKTGGEIPIEERKPEEVTHLNGVRIAPEGVSALNPAFDVTPHRYIKAIITDKGVIEPPYLKNIKARLKK